MLSNCGLLRSANHGRSLPQVGVGDALSNGLSSLNCHRATGERPITVARRHTCM
jgi:hypothetical protein